MGLQIPESTINAPAEAALLGGVFHSVHMALSRDRKHQRQAIRFYGILGFEIIHGGEDAAFTSFRAGTSYLNLIAQPAERKWSWWGRVIFYHSDVDALHARVVAAGYRPDTAPRDAEWGERFFHLTDPDGHELSFAWPLR
jgi:uncharacterized glyoxalase superfamily protein PhnB